MPLHTIMTVARVPRMNMPPGTSCRVKASDRASDQDPICGVIDCQQPYRIYWAGITWCCSDSIWWIAANEYYLRKAWQYQSTADSNSVCIMEDNGAAHHGQHISQGECINGLGNLGHATTVGDVFDAVPRIITSTLVVKVVTNSCILTAREPLVNMPPSDDIWGQTCNNSINMQGP